MKLEQRGTSFSFRKHVRDESGKLVMRRYTLTSTDKTSAKREMHEVLARVGRENHIDPGAMTVEELCRRWLDRGSLGSDWVPTTYDRHAGIVRDHIVPVIGNLRLRTLGPIRVQDAVDVWVKRPSANPRRPGVLSQRSVYANYSTLRTAMNFAVNQQLIPTNPCTIRVSRQSDMKKQKGLPVDKLILLIVAARSWWFFPHVILLILTGMRRGELFGLRWSSIDFEGRQLLVDAVVAKNKQRKYAYRTFPKTSASIRNIALPESALYVLRWQRQHLEELYAAMGAELTAEDFVFPGQGLGGVFNPDVLSSAFSWLIRSKDVPKIALRDLRHSNARAHLSAGTGLETIMEILGHSMFSTTADFYAGIDDHVHHSAAQRLDTHFSEAHDLIRRQLPGVA
jgi:integrase